MKLASPGLALALCLLSAVPEALACAVLVPSDRLPGETDAELVNRGKRMRQDALRAQADAVFLAQASAARMVGQVQADYTLTPFLSLYDNAIIPEALVLRDSPFVTSCTVRPELGHVYVVYAERAEPGWRIIEIVQHGDLQDRPPSMPTAREVARGLYALPTYPE